MSNPQYPYSTQPQLITTAAFVPQQAQNQQVVPNQQSLLSQYQPYGQSNYAPQRYAQSGYGAMPQTSGSSQNQADALWMGDIDSWMDENFIFSLFAHTGEVVNVKIIRDRQSGQSHGYGFVYFTSPQSAQYVLDSFNGQPIPGTNRVFRLNRAAYGMNTQKRNESQAIFVGDLAPDVTDYYLQSTFQYYYPSVYSARVVCDPHSGISKGYGFVYFNDETEKNRALTEMQGFPLPYRPIKVNVASKRGQAQPQIQPQIPSQTLGPADPENTTVFVGGIDPMVTHDVLRAAFSQFGEIAGIKIPHGKGCGFVEFATHEAAARVLKELNGSAIIGNSQVRLSWGRPTVKSTDDTQTEESQSSQDSNPEAQEPENQTEASQGNLNVEASTEEKKSEESDADNQKSEEEESKPTEETTLEEKTASDDNKSQEEITSKTETKETAEEIEETSTKKSSNSQQEEQPSKRRKTENENTVQN